MAEHKMIAIGDLSCDCKDCRLHRTEQRLQYIEKEYKALCVKAEAMRLVLAPLSIKAGISEGNLIELLTEAENSLKEDTCESCNQDLGDDAPLYEDADICRKCHDEINEAEFLEEEHF